VSYVCQRGIKPFSALNLTKENVKPTVLSQSSAVLNAKFAIEMQRKLCGPIFFSRLRGCLTRRKRTILGIGAQVLASAFDAWSCNFLYSNNSPRSMPAKHWRQCNVVAAKVCRIFMRLAASRPPFTLRFAASRMKF
jgi:hypothetical protein